MLDFKSFLNEKLHTIKDAEGVLYLIQKHISKKAKLIGGFGKGKTKSNHDIDLLIPDKKFTKKLKDKLFKLLNAESVEDTDWGGWYFNKTSFGDVDIFHTTEDFDY